MLQIKTEQALVSLETRMEAEELEAYLVLTNLQSFHYNLTLILTYSSVADPKPDLSDPYAFGPSGSGSRSSSQRYGSGSGYGVLKVNDENSRIRNRIRIHTKMSWIRNTDLQTMAGTQIFFKSTNHKSKFFLGVPNPQITNPQFFSGK